MQYNN